MIGYSDSDWAGDTRIRRSVSAGLAMHCSHALNTWASMQAVLVLSPAEAELYARSRTDREALGIRSYTSDLGRSMQRVHGWTHQGRRPSSIGRA